MYVSQYNSQQFILAPFKNVVSTVDYLVDFPSRKMVKCIKFVTK